MEDKKVAVFGIYRGVDEAERAVDTLVLERFSNNDISVLLPDNQSSKEFAHEKNTKAPEGTATGAATGGTIGGTLGLLAGIGALAIPGVGPFIAAGPIMATLAGLASVERSVGWSARSSAWAFPSTKPSGMRVASRMAACCCQSIAQRRTRSLEPRTS